MTDVSVRITWWIAIGLAFGAVIVTVPMQSAAQRGTDLTARIRAEAPSTWETYRQANRYPQGTMRQENMATGQQSPYRGEIKIKSNEECRLLQITNLSDGMSEVIAQNPQYCFRLKSGKNSSWVLVSFVQRDDEQHQDSIREIEKLIDTRGFAAVERVVRISPDNQFIGDIVFSARSRITNLKQTAHDGQAVTELAFELTPDPNEPRQLLGGTLLLDPERGWLPVGQTSRVQNKAGIGAYTTEWNYGPGNNPLPKRVVERTEYTVKSQPEKWRATFTTDYELSVPEHLPEVQEFTLTAFGLPEPVGVAWKKPRSNAIWFLVAAVGFGALAILFAYLRRRAGVPTT